jgi:hypothetical protein
MTDPTFGDILGFYLNFHQSNKGLSANPSTEKLSGLCIVDEKRRVY